MMPDSINFKFPCDSFNDVLHYFTLVPAMHTFFYVVAEYVNTSSLERLTLFCAFHFLSCSYHTTKLLSSWCKEIKRNRFLLLNLLSQIHLLPLPQNTYVISYHLLSFLTLRPSLRKRGTADQVIGIKIFLWETDTCQDWTTDLSSTGTKWQTHVLQVQLSSLLHQTNSLITEWSKLQTEF